MSSNSDILKDLLLEDYRYRAEAMKNSEQVGETRFNIFVGLATLLLGAVVALSTEDTGPKDDALKSIVLAIFFTLFVVGSMTLLRIIKRNERTDECKHDLDHIRHTFITLFDQEGLLVDYHPVGAANSKQSSKLQVRSFGGLAHTMSAINSLLVAGFFACLVLPFKDNFSLSAPITRVALVCAAIAFAISLLMQTSYIKNREDKAKAKLEKACERLNPKP